MSAAPRQRRRGVTRGYVTGVIAAAVGLTLALLVGGWGAIVWTTGRSPVETPGIWLLAGEALVLLAVAALIWGLWRQALVLLRGRWAPSWGHVVLLGATAYLIWCVGGAAFGMSVGETWTSPFALLLAVDWSVGSLALWAVLARRVYTNRPPPRWPWERREEQEEFEELAAEFDRDAQPGSGPEDRDDWGEAR